jgi:hypothetical protein
LAFSLLVLSVALSISLSTYLKVLLTASPFSFSETHDCSFHFSVLPVVCSRALMANDAFHGSVLAYGVTRFFGSAAILVPTLTVAPMVCSTPAFLKFSWVVILWTRARSWSFLLFSSVSSFSS